MNDTPGAPGSAGAPRSAWRRLVLPAVAALDATALVALAPDWAQLARGLSAPNAWVASIGADQAAARLAAAALWCAAVWLGFGLTAILLAAAPGVTGAIGRHVARRVLPAALVRTVAGTIGLSVLLAPAAAGAHVVGQHGGSNLGSGSHPTQGLSIATATATAPAWPSDRPLTTRPSPGWPSAPGQPSTTQPATSSTSVPPATAEQVTVRPGDSLWLITAQRLGPSASAAEIAVAWRQSYSANRAVIGSDPGMLHPGEVLAIPSTAPPTAGPSSGQPEGGTL